MCQKEISLEGLIGNDIFTDTVYINPISEGVDTYKCLPVPCRMNGELPGDVVLIGKDIITRPDHLEKGIEAFTSESDCVMNDQTVHFEVECDGEENVETNECECKLNLMITFLIMFCCTDSIDVDVQQNWQNERDRTLKVECENRKAFYRVRSEHSNSREDRRWEWSCRTMAKSNFDDTYWTDYVNDWDKVFFFSCKANYIMCGVESYHKNDAEDRRWKFKCCSAKSHFTRNCELSDYANDFDRTMDYDVGGSKVITAAYSYHSNGKE